MKLKRSEKGLHTLPLEKEATKDLKTLVAFILFFFLKNKSYESSFKIP